MPDVLGRDRHRYAGKSTLVAGSGHSAIGTIVALAVLAESFPGTRVSWAIRSDRLDRLYGGGNADGLPARGELGQRLKALVDSGRIEVHAGFRIAALENRPTGIDVVADDDRRITGIGEIVAATG